MLIDSGRESTTVPWLPRHRNCLEAITACNDLGTAARNVAHSKGKTASTGPQAFSRRSLDSLLAHCASGHLPLATLPCNKVEMELLLPSRAGNFISVTNNVT